jgi:hypothetical protein
MYMQEQKKTSAQYRQVRVGDIDLADTSYALHPFPLESDSELLRSITTLGMLHPPLLLECSENKFIVLSGRRSLQAVQAVGENDIFFITALIVQYSRSDPMFFATLLRHRLMGYSLSVIEQAVFLQKAMESLATEEVVHLLPMLGLQEKPHIPGQFIALLELDDAVQLGLHKGIIARRSGKKFARFSLADQKTLAEIINEYQVGGSKQQKLIDQVFQLTKRQRISVEELLGRWRELAKDKQQNGPQRITSLLSWLERECQPRCTQAEEDFRKFCRQLKLPAGVQVDHSPAFEEELVTLSMDFSSREELVVVWPQIQALLQRDHS